MGMQYQNRELAKYLFFSAIFADYNGSISIVLLPLCWYKAVSKLLQNLLSGARLQVPKVFEKSKELSGGEFSFLMGRALWLLSACISFWSDTQCHHKKDKIFLKAGVSRCRM